MTRPRIRTTHVTALLAAALALGTAACSSPAPVKADEAAATNAPGGAFRLVDTNGKTVTEQTLKGETLCDLLRLHALP